MRVLTSDSVLIDQRLDTRSGRPQSSAAPPTMRNSVQAQRRRECGSVGSLCANMIRASTTVRSEELITFYLRIVLHSLEIGDR